MIIKHQNNHINFFEKFSLKISKGNQCKIEEKIQIPLIVICEVQTKKSRGIIINQFLSKIVPHVYFSFFYNILYIL